MTAVLFNPQRGPGAIFGPMVASNVGVSPGAGALAFTTAAPTVVQTGTRVLAPGPGVLSIATAEPTVSQSAQQFVGPDVGALTLSRYAPSVTQSNADSLVAAATWAYVLSNGKTAGQTLVENNAMLAALIAAPGGWNTLIEGPYSAGDLLRILAAVAAGKTTIDDHGKGAATVEFEAVDDSAVRVSAEMQGSERTSVTLTP